VKEAVAQRAAAGSAVRSILVTDRENAAALLYYARDLATPVTVWRAQAAPTNHFELTRPFVGDAKQQPALLLSDASGSRNVVENFNEAVSLGRRAIAAGSFTSRAAELFVVSGFKGR
jgi:hypothetical protein